MLKKFAIALMVNSIAVVAFAQQDPSISKPSDKTATATTEKGKDGKPKTSKKQSKATSKTPQNILVTDEDIKKHKHIIDDFKPPADSTVL